MNDNNISIAIDVMGGDNSPLKTLKGAEIFLKKNNDVNIFLFGKKELIEETINKYKIKLFNYKITDTQENVQNDDSPNDIIRNRKDSSISKGLEFIKGNKKSGFVSAGNTAAIMILSRLKLGIPAL